MRRTSPQRTWWLTGIGVGGYLGWRLVRRMVGMDLKDKVVLITGGSRGLGLCLAREFARQGCHLVLCARDARELQQAERDIASRDAQVLTLPCDVSDRAQVEEMIRTAIDRMGHIDILINNASIIQVGPVESMTLEDFERALAINFWGGVYATMAVLPHFRQRRFGHIVNITSIGGKIAVPHLLPYDAAKFAMVGFSEGLHAELAAENIVVTTVIPGLMRTGSPVNAFFKGQSGREYAWFTLGDITPLTAMSARRAARRIVLATRRGEAEVTLSWQARLLRLTHDIFPSLTSEILTFVNRLLPDAEGAGTQEMRGSEVTGAAPKVSRIVERYAQRFNQHGGNSHAVPPEASQR
ncbi:MAG TPA: SDR family NAD(P)-dependent oxidoreductase [Polyangia bacterium]|jgi:NAD(P)-dependent dehydrogenase (short-subunit alcohol dehydrogenase family)|nr:SDR family NAD(P)-dependent oxidoreductase [Polyangia bacterium]